MVGLRLVGCLDTHLWLMLLFSEQSHLTGLAGTTPRAAIAPGTRRCSP